LTGGKNAGEGEILSRGSRSGRQRGPFDKRAASQFGFHDNLIVSTGRKNCKSNGLATFVASVILRLPFSGIEPEN
jgi:hypothetical protein